MSLKGFHKRTSTYLGGDSRHQDLLLKEQEVVFLKGHR